MSLAELALAFAGAFVGGVMVGLLLRDHLEDVVERLFDWGGPR